MLQRNAAIVNGMMAAVWTFYENDAVCMLKLLILLIIQAKLLFFWVVAITISFVIPCNKILKAKMWYAASDGECRQHKCNILN